MCKRKNIFFSFHNFQIENRHSVIVLDAVISILISYNANVCTLKVQGSIKYPRISSVIVFYISFC